jgi:hypothetical protein
MCADVHSHDAVVYDEKYGAQIAFNFHGINCATVFCGKREFCAFATEDQTDSL